MEKFKFTPKKKPERHVVSIHFDGSMRSRLEKACEKLNIQLGTGSGSTLVKSQQELIRQMVDHCLKDMGL